MKDTNLRVPFSLRLLWWTSTAMSQATLGKGPFLKNEGSCKWPYMLGSRFSPASEDYSLLRDLEPELPS